jgi:hypothetical protein
MSSNLQLRIRQEVELIERFTGAYGRQFDELIGRLNANPTAADGQCLRLCVEAVNMVLCLQGQLARVLDDLSKESAPQRGSSLKAA